VLAAACQSAPPAPAPRIVQPGAPGQDSRVVTTIPPATNKPTPADVAFMQGMIMHHAQAIDMVALLKTRTSRESMRLLGLRIEVSQKDEIAMMRRWLKEQGAAEPDEHAHHSGALMPGMLTADQMSALAAAKDSEFDRLFLELMIKHHEGALAMVKTLMESPGAGQLSSVSAFASDVEADQSAEIQRMRILRASIKDVR
jgi:uncharacterized protein (DUF305 family)